MSDASSILIEAREAPSALPNLLTQVRAGKEVVIVEDGRPVAVLRGASAPRPIVAGLWNGYPLPPDADLIGPDPDLDMALSEWEIREP